MKMVYETPKMKAELFQTNAYCNSCGVEKVFGYIEVDANHEITTGWGSMLQVVASVMGKFTFMGDKAISSKNQYTQESQYYYVAEEDSSVYLEWSQPYQTFVLYKEGGVNTGYYDSNDRQIFDGSSTLQTNNGNQWSNPSFEQQSHMIDANGSVSGTADSWWADHCMGEIATENVNGSYTIENS